jgi:hypothetical protein
MMRARIHGELSVESIKCAEGTKLWPRQQREKDRICGGMRQNQ